MNDKINQKLEGINASLINAVICGIGIVALMASFFSTNADYKNILISTGCYKIPQRKIVLDLFLKRT